MPALPKLELIGNARHHVVAGSDEFMLPADAYAKLDLSEPVHSDAGTLVFWIMPQWRDATESHVFLTLPWSDGGYLAISQGWWEPNGSRKLYFVLNNREAAFCYLPGKYDLKLFVANEWTMIAATWLAGSPGRIRLYVDGESICDRRLTIAANRQSTRVAYLGSDSGATDRRQRSAEFTLRRFEIVDHELSDDEIAHRYASLDGAVRRKWMREIVNGDEQSPHNERRALFDEDAHWLQSRAEIRETVKRVKAAGFNTYVVCVWNGAEALFKTDRAVIASRYRAASTRDYDPLTDLIEVAHAAGVEVHLWFYVSKRTGNNFPRELWDGAPDGAFNVHAPEFGRFIAGLIGDAAANYAIDGINLDYVRTLGICSSERCADDYRKQFKRELSRDWLAQEHGVRSDELIAWQSAAVGEIVRRIVLEARAARPKLLIDIDTIGIDHSRAHQGADALAWVREGIVDLVFHMAYETPLDVAHINEVYAALPVGKLAVLFRNYRDTSGKAVASRGAVVADTVQVIRKLWPGSGIGVYHYPWTTADQIASLSRGVFADGATP
jgi:hypothetical protein